MRSRTGITRIVMNRSTPPWTTPRTATSLTRTTILVHEWVTGGGLAGRPLPESWAAEGHAMRRAIASDFAAVQGVRVVVTLDDRFPEEQCSWTVVRLGPGEEPVEFPRLVAAVDYTVLIAPE